jgi:hypothetical protein
MLSEEGMNRKVHLETLKAKCARVECLTAERERERERERRGNIRE